MVLGNVRNYNNTAVGDEVLLMLNSGRSWTMTQNAGQPIVVGSKVGAGGLAAAADASQAVRLIGMTANLKFQALGLVGALNVI